MSVFIIDQEELVRRGLIGVLSAHHDIAVVGAAASAEEALSQIQAARPELVLLDAGLPEGVGITASRALRAADPGLRCLVLTSFDDDEALLAAVLAGAAGYLVTQIGGSSLVDGIRQVAQGGSLLDVADTEALLERLRIAADGDGGTPPLLPRERQVLDLVAQGRTDPEIAGTLGIAVAEVGELVSGIFVTLGPRGRTGGALLGGGLRGRGLLPSGTRS